jgi:NAD(P)-dependent dehydrogenase (short-subunit alcohol dehydrogenase family)
MGNSVDGKVCVITGAGSGMGRASAMEMARQGGKIVVADINLESGNETVRLIRADGGTAEFASVDLRKPGTIASLMNTAAELYGGIDVLHNNAAILESEITDKNSIEELSEDAWEILYEVNLRAVWMAIKYAVPYLKSSHGPSIINVASIGAYVAMPMSAAYCATKAAVVMLTKAAASDLAKFGIRANCYCPGVIDTQKTRKYHEAADDKEAIMKVLTGANLIPRLGRPEEVAKLACFLASDDSSFITGASYVIDGGMLAWRGSNA